MLTLEMIPCKTTGGSKERPTLQAVKHTGNFTELIRRTQALRAGNQEDSRNKGLSLSTQRVRKRVQSLARYACPLAFAHAPFLLFLRREKHLLLTDLPQDPLFKDMKNQLKSNIDPLERVKVGFGKHKGLTAARMKRLDPQYFTWALANVQFFADAVSRAQDASPSIPKRLPGQSHSDYLKDLLRSALEHGVSPMDGPSAKELRPHFLSYLATHYLEDLSPLTHPMEPHQLEPSFAPY